MTIQVLVVDDVQAMAEQYAYDLKRVGKYDTIVAAGGGEALDLLGREPIDCVVLDLEMPGTDGFDVLRGLQQRGIDTPVIVYTGTGSYDRCVQAVRLGAYGFVDKAEPIERVVQEIENAVTRGRMAKELRSLRSRFDGETSLIGGSVPMRALCSAIERGSRIPRRVLEDRQVMRLGGSRAIPVTARVVAATNRDLEREVAAGRFRQDLYYRLNVHTLVVPPLRERLADIPVLVDHLLRSIASHLRVRPKTISPEALALLAAYDWRKNNVRELRNCLERMMIASDAAIIDVPDVPPEIQVEELDDVSDPTAAPGTLKALKAQAERQIVLTALDKHGWQVTRTAEALGLAYHSSLLKIMRRHGLSKGIRRDT